MNILCIKKNIDDDCNKRVSSSITSGKDHRFMFGIFCIAIGTASIKSFIVLSLTINKKNQKLYIFLNRKQCII